MWSSVNEQITDGTSGLVPNSEPSALIVGTSSKGSANPIAFGKKSNIQEIFGYGELPKRLISMQQTMGDVSVLAMRTEGDINGDISDITTAGNININIVGTPLYQSNVEIEVHTEGDIGQAEVKINVSGFDQFSKIHLIPEDGMLAIESLGIIIAFPLEVTYFTNSKWSFTTTSPTSSIEVLKESIQRALEIHTPEFILIAQDVNASIVKHLGELSEHLFEDHKPVLILTETELDKSVSFEDAIAIKQAEFANMEFRFVSVVCQPLDSKYIASGLLAGHLTKARVNQSVGATNYFAVYNMNLPIKWTNVHSRALDESRFITLRTYAGLKNLFWSNGRTMGGEQSDYRFIEVVRTVFKAIRLARKASLPYIHAAGDQIGLQNLVSEVRNSIEGMATNTPKELDSIEVELPEGQDIVNKGVRLDISLYGIPVIRKILLNFMFKYNTNK